MVLRVQVTESSKEKSERNLRKFEASFKFNTYFINYEKSDAILKKKIKKLLVKI